MTSYEAVELLNQLINAIDERSSLLALLHKIEEYYDHAHKSVKESVTTGDATKRAQSFDGFRGNIQNAYAVNLNQFSSRKVYADSEHILSVLSALKANQQLNDDSSISALEKRASTFLEVYEKFVHSYSLSDTLDVIRAGHDLLFAVQDFFGLAQFIKGHLETGLIAIPPGHQEVSLFLSSSNDYKVFLAKLSAINELYAEMCSLVGVSPAQYPLQIIKVESGSLWLKVFGESRVITLLIQSIEAGASYLYRRFTSEGQMQSIPKQVEAVESVLRLTENLERAGIDMTQAKDNLQKSSVLISNQLNSLLQGVASIKINDETFGISKAFEEKFIKESRGLFLEDRNKGDEDGEGQNGSGDGEAE